ncbi:MAG: GumC family protein [Planctomycetota bacterium]|jgi:uncharacterized protein involved in exopolysaccharide biosynthesis
MDLKHIAFVVFRHKYKIIVFILASLFIVLLVLRQKTPIYEATTQIFVKLGREISVPSQDIMEDSSYIIQKRRQDIYAEVEILQSSYLIEEVVRKIGHQKILPFSKQSKSEDSFQVLSVIISSISKLRKLIRDILIPAVDNNLTKEQQAVLTIQSKLKVIPKIISDTIKIVYYDSSIEQAKLILNTFLDSYLERHIEVHKGTSMQAVFKPQADYYQKKMEDIEKKLERLKKKENIFSLDSQRNELIRQKARIRSELEHTQREILIKIDKINRIKKQITSLSQIVELPETKDQNPVINTLKEKLIELELQKEQLEVSSVTTEIKKVKEQLRKEQARVLFTNQKDLEVLKLREKTLKKEIKKYVTELEQINKVDAVKQVLEREREISKRNYLLYTKETEEARISQAMDLAKITNVRIIQPVSVVSQNKGLANSIILILTTGISLFISLGLVFLIDYLDHSISTAKDIEELLNLTVLGSIGEYRSASGINYSDQKIRMKKS